MATPLERLTAAISDRYRIERELGGGGMARVFLAEELALNRQVVVKVIAPHLTEGLSAERFAREVKLAARLQQANIVPVLSAGDAGGVAYYTMPFVRGDSLRARLASREPIPLGEGVGILRDVARALAYAHAEGIVHRDIKPENILLSHGTAMVTDFGIAKALSASLTEEGAAATLTQTGSTIGTPAYMAPEQVAGDPSTNQRADLYAWGLLAWEVLVGKHPFADRTPQALVAAQMSEVPAAVTALRPDVPRGLGDLIRRCLEKDPARRPASAGELLAELDAVVTPTGSGATQVEPARAPLPRKALIGTGLIALVAIVAFALLRPRTPSGVAAAPEWDRSIAVLPLTNLGGDKSDDYFGIGLAEEMTRALTKAGVRVIGRVSAGALLARGMDERAIANELGVGSLLTGSVQRDAGQVRISVALSAADGTVRWAQAYDRPITNVFAVQDEIAREVARELLGSLGGGAPGTLMRQETENPEAHSLLLQGVVLWNRRTGPAIRQAISLLEQAVGLDPRYARAHAWLGMANAVLPFYAQVETDLYMERALEADERALAMDSTVPEAHASAGMALMTMGRHREAEVRFRRALALDSTFASSWGWYGILAVRQGDFAEARRRIGRAIELEPASMISRVQYLQVANIARRYAEADSAARSVLALDSSFSMAWLQGAEAIAGLDRMDEAIELMERRVVGKSEVRPTEVDGVYAWMLARAGRKAEAGVVLKRLRSANGGRLPPTGVVAATLEVLGDHEAAVTVLTEAVQQHDPWLWYSRKERYDQLRADPRVAALLAPLEKW